MSTFILVLLIGAIILGGVIFVAGFFFEHNQTEGNRSESPALSSIEDPNRLIKIAERHENRERWTQAAETWSRYLELEPEVEDARYRRGIAYLKEGNPSATIRDLESVQEQTETPPDRLLLHLGRAYHQQNQPLEALGCLEKYLEHHPGDLAVCRETAQLARTLDKPSRARAVYERICREESPFLQVEGSLSLAEIDLDDNTPERAKSYLDEVEQQFNKGNLTDEQHKEYLYQQARYREALGKQAEADQLFRTLYGQDPDYRNVRKIVEEKIHNMSEDRLIQNMVRLDRDEFLKHSERIVRNMGYEVIQSDSLNPEEIEITAIEKEKKLKVNRMLFSFKKWTNQIGEFPLKEFEMKLLENRYDRGFFVCPGGFNQKSIEYAKSSRALDLLGPSQLLDYLREVEKEKLKSI